MKIVTSDSEVPLYITGADLDHTSVPVVLLLAWDKENNYIYPVVSDDISTDINTDDNKGTASQGEDREADAPLPVVGVILIPNEPMTLAAFKSNIKDQGKSLFMNLNVSIREKTLVWDVECALGRAPRVK